MNSRESPASGASTPSSAEPLRRGPLPPRRQGGEDPRAAIAVTTDDAMALIGLALRSHRNVSIGPEMMGLRLLGSTSYFILSRDLLRPGCVRSGP